MGQSLSRRPSSVSVQEHEHNTQPTRRSLPSRILSSIPKPSIRSRPASVATSSTLPASSEQTLRGRKRLWRLSRRHDVPSNTVGDLPHPLAEHDEHPDDRDVDEFGVITNRVPDSHRDSSTSSSKGKEKARESLDDDQHDVDPSAAIPSSSTIRPLTPPSQADDQDEVVIAPTDPPSLPRQPSPLPRLLASEPSFVPPAPTPAPQPQSSSQTNNNPRPFPPPGTLVVVQGVVHTTDVPRPPERSAPAPNSTVPTPSNDASSQNANRVSGPDASSTRPSSVPPSSRSRSPLSAIPPRPSSMVPAVPSPPPLDSSTEPSSSNSSGRESTSNTAGGNEDEDRAQPYPHGISMAQGPTGASGLSASSIDVLGTLLSVAAAATAASLLTGSSEPIFSSGLTSSQPQPPSNPIPPPSSFNPNAPSERPLSPTPTSDAGRMRHVWSSLRDRLGLGSSNASNDTNSSSSPGLGTSPQASDVVRPRDPREIMLAEMARAFNLGLGLGGPRGNTSAVPSSNSNTPEVSSPDNGDAPASDRNVDQPPLPPPDSFERFLIDLQNDLRVTLMQSHESDVFEGDHVPQGGDATVEDTVEDDQPLPELRSLSDSDSEEYEPMLYGSDHDDGLDPEDDEDDEDDDVHTAHEELSGRTSPAVSALGTGIHSPFGVRGTPGSSAAIAPTAPIFTAYPSVSDADTEPDPDHAADNDKTRDGDTEHATSSVSSGVGSNAPSDCLSTSETRSPEWQAAPRERAACGVGYSPEASNGAQGMGLEGRRAVLGNFAVPPHGAQSPSNVSGTEPLRNSFPLETSSSGVSTSNIPTLLTGVSASPAETSAPPSTSTSTPSSDSEPAARSSSSTEPIPGDSMPFRLPFTASSASRTEHTPGGGINWWRMYRFPAIASPLTGQQGQGTQPSSPSRTPAQDPSLSSTSSPWIRTQDQTQQNEVIVPRGEPQPSGLQSGLSAPSSGPSTPSMNIPGMVSATNQSTSTRASENSSPPTNPGTNGPEHRGVVVPVIVVGLQSVNMDRQRPQTPHPHMHEHQHVPPMGNEDGEDVDFDSFDQPMSMPMHVPEPPGFPHYHTPSHTFQQEQQHASQQPPHGRTWQSRAANAFRNLRPSRRNEDVASPQPQETPGSRTFLIYVIGGYYPPDHQIITGGNLDSFEALWELAELLGQVKPPTVSKDEIDKSGLEIIKSSMLEEYEKSGRVASNCVDRCLICLDDYSPEDDLRVLTCRHTFHQGCVDRWLETGRNNCPACRSKGVGTDNAASSSTASPGPAVL